MPPGSLLGLFAPVVEGWPEASVPPGSLLGLFAPVVEGWPEASVPPGSLLGVFAPVVEGWPEASVPLLLRCPRRLSLVLGVGAVFLLVLGVRAVRGGTVGTGIGNGDRAPGTHQQARCEHANTCSQAQTQQTHLLLLLPTSHRRLAGSPNVCHIVA